MEQPAPPSTGRIVFAVSFVLIIMGATVALAAREISALGLSGEAATGEVVEHFRRVPASLDQHHEHRYMLALIVEGESLRYVAEVDAAAYESLKDGDEVQMLRIPGDAESAVLGGAEEARKQAQLGRVLFPAGLLTVAAGLGAMIWLAFRS